MIPILKSFLLMLVTIINQLSNYCAKNCAKEPALYHCNVYDFGTGFIPGLILKVARN